METAAPSPLGMGPEARPRPYLRPHRCALLLYHWGPRLPSVSLGGWRSSPPSRAMLMVCDSPFHQAFCFHCSSFSSRRRVARPLGSWVAWRPVSVPLASRPRPYHGAFRVAPLCSHCADQFAPRHLDAVGTVGPCASTTSCHPRVGLVGFSLGFHLLLLVQPDAYLLGNHVCPVQVLHQPGCVLHCEVDALPDDEHLRLPTSHLRHPYR